jgi:acyl-CoA synthetase (NDP forming)
VAEQMGFPVVMKINAADVTHKSDVEVWSSMRNAAEVRSQYLEILASVRRARRRRGRRRALQSTRRGRHGRELYSACSAIRCSAR